MGIFKQKIMNIQFHTKKAELPEPIKTKIEKRLEKLKKYKTSGQVLIIRVDIIRDQHHRKGDVFSVEARVEFPGKALRVLESGEDILSAFDIVYKKIERQARDLKEKHVERKKKY